MYFYNVPIKPDKIFENHSEPDIINDRKLSGKKVHIKMVRKRQFTPEFKTKIVLEILKEEKQLGELASQYELSPNQLRNWKKRIP